jgi:hypothetical protein
MLTCKLHCGSYESTTAFTLNKILIKIFSQIGLFEKKDLEQGAKKLRNMFYIYVIFLLTLMWYKIKVST